MKTYSALQYFLVALLMFAGCKSSWHPAPEKKADTLILNSLILGKGLTIIEKKDSTYWIRVDISFHDYPINFDSLYRDTIFLNFLHLKRGQFGTINYTSPFEEHVSKPIETDSVYRVDWEPTKGQTFKFGPIYKGDTSIKVLDTSIIYQSRYRVIIMDKEKKISYDSIDGTIRVFDSAATIRELYKWIESSTPKFSPPIKPDKKNGYIGLY